MPREWIDVEELRKAQFAEREKPELAGQTKSGWYDAKNPALSNPPRKDK